MFAEANDSDKVGSVLEDQATVKTQDAEEQESGDRTTVKTEFYYHGGYGSVLESYNTSGTTYGSSLPSTYQPGFIFIGWFEEMYNEGIEYTSNSIVPDHDIILHAHWGQFHEVINVGAAKDLNIYGSNITYLYNGMNITMWTATGSNEQKWVFNCDEIYRIYFRSYVDTNYGLNVYRAGSPWNCTVHETIGNETDAQIDIIEVSVGHYNIKLHNYNLYLTADGSLDGSNVYWVSYTGNNNQLWTFSLNPY